MGSYQKRGGLKNSAEKPPNYKGPCMDSLH